MGPLVYVLNLTKFAFRHNRALYLSVILSLVSVAIELLAMCSLLPLFTLVSGSRPPSGDIIATGLHLIGCPVTARTLLWTFLGLFAARVVTQLLGQTLSMHLGRRVMAQLGSAAFERITKTLSLSEINEKSIGFYIGLAGDEAFRASVVVISLTQFVSTLALSLLYFGAILRYSPATAGGLALFLVATAIVLGGVIRASHRLGARQVVESRKAASVFLDALNNLKAVRAFSAETYVSSLYGTLIFAYTRLWFWIDELSLLSKLIPVLLLLAAAGTWLAVSTVALDGASLPFIVTMIVLLMRFFPTLGQGVALLMKIASDARSGQDITDVLDRQLPAGHEGGESLAAIESIEFRSVSFAYDPSPGREILRDASLKLERGKTYAIVGRSGIGKSTLVDLVLRFYPADSGEILINGKEVTSLSAADIRRKIVLVSQQAAIFNDTVTNNIRLGLEATPADVESACRLACIHDLVEAMPSGYDTVLQFQGENLSGGQRQRIAIARGLLRNPDVLILDESTNALDKQTQSKVIANLLKAQAGKMLVFVTHDPEIAAIADVSIDMAGLAGAGDVPTARASPGT